MPQNLEITGRLCYYDRNDAVCGERPGTEREGGTVCFVERPRSDLPEILKIYARAREAMAAAGNPGQWGASFPPEELLKEDIDSNRLFVYLVNGELEAVFAFILGPDPTYAVIEDGQWLNDTLPYGTIHRLASAGKRKGVATDVITWCLGALPESLRCRHPRRPTKPCSTFWKKPVSPAAASSMWQTAPPALPTSGCPLPCRWNIKEVLT